MLPVTHIKSLLCDFFSWTNTISSEVFPAKIDMGCDYFCFPKILTIDQELFALNLFLQHLCL